MLVRTIQRKSGNVQGSLKPPRPRAIEVAKGVAMLMEAKELPAAH
jgi:hypothetical protein